jgi:hypothetical protein
MSSAKCNVFPYTTQRKGVYPHQRQKMHGISGQKEKFHLVALVMWWQKFSELLIVHMKSHGTVWEDTVIDLICCHIRWLNQAIVIPCLLLRQPGQQGVKMRSALEAHMHRREYHSREAVTPPCQTLDNNNYRFGHEVTRFAQPYIHTDTLSVLLSALYLYLFPRVLIWRRMYMSGAFVLSQLNNLLWL